MKRLAVVILLLSCVVRGGELSLKGGLVLHDAVIKGVPGGKVLIVESSGGVGMYSLSQLMPDSAATVSNLLSGARIEWPVTVPEERLPSGRHLNRISAESQQQRLPACQALNGTQAQPSGSRRVRMSDYAWLASLRTAWKVTH